jgi:hypothetical protein
VAAQKKIKQRKVKMTEKTKAVPGSARKVKKQTGRTKPVMVKESLATLIEDGMAQFDNVETLVAVKSISSTLQDTAERLAKIEPNELMPMMDALSDVSGEQNANQFYQAATGKLRELITAVQGAKAAIDGEISRLQTGASGGDTSDAALDGGLDAPPAPGGPEMPPGPPGDVPEANPPSPDVPGEDAPVPLPPEEPMDGATGFAGRARKESAKPRRGGKLMESNASDDPEFRGHMESCGQFSPKCISFASDILDHIHDLSTSGEVRNKLVKALGHVLSMSNITDVWDDPSAVAEHGVATHFANGPMGEVAKAPETAKILKDITKLAHMISMKHTGDLAEDDALGPMVPAAAPIVKPPVPAAPLAAGPVFESKRRAKNVKRLRESRNPDRMILTVFRNVLRECRNVGLAVRGTARAFGLDVADVVVVIREAKKLAEDAVPSLMGVEMGQPTADNVVDKGVNVSLLGQNPTAATPVAGKPNKPMTPADMRAAKQATDAQDKTAQANGQPLQPITSPKPNVPVQPVKGQQAMNPVVSPQMRQQQRANMPQNNATLPNMPGKVVNNGNVRTV